MRARRDHPGLRAEQRRDLTLTPKQDGGPVNALPKAYVEVDRKIGAEKEVWTRKLTFNEKK